MNRVATLSKLGDDIRMFVESSVQTLRELNPGKEAIHV